MSGLSLVKLKDRTHFVEIMFLQWAKYLFYSAQKFLHARDLRKYESNFCFHRVKSIIWTFVYIRAPCERKAKARISYARDKKIILKAI